MKFQRIFICPEESGTAGEGRADSMPNDLSSEKRYLSGVIRKIDAMRDELETNATDLRKYIMQERRRIWDDFSH